DDERRRGRCDSAEEGEDGERRHPGHEQPPASVEVAEPPAEHEEECIRDAVAGDDELEDRLRCVETGTDRRQRDGDDEEVGDRDECPEEDGGEADARKGGLSGHDLTMPSQLNPVPERGYPGINATCLNVTPAAILAP